jgi:lipoate-protein ligase A
MILHVHPFEVADGPAQMAIDDAMLDAAEEGVASLRLYDWSKPTLSLGYFQPAAVRLARPALAALPWLRRSSGGGAILHGDGDLTYALALPAAREWHDGEPWLCRFHHLLQRVFKTYGTKTKAVACGEEVKLDPALCFLHHTPGDLVHDGIKVVGSAQRQQRGALLQHGTIMLRDSMLVPELKGLEIHSADLRHALAVEIADETGWTIQESELPAMPVKKNRYRTAEWNEKR